MFNRFIFWRKCAIDSITKLRQIVQVIDNVEMKRSNHKCITLIALIEAATPNSKQIIRHYSISFRYVYFVVIRIGNGVWSLEIVLHSLPNCFLHTLFIRITTCMPYLAKENGISQISSFILQIKNSPLFVLCGRKCVDTRISLIQMNLNPDITCKSIQIENNKHTKHTHTTCTT